MGVTFKLKVRNPVIPTGAIGANVNWTMPPYESSPDTMPTETSAVTFSGMQVPGAFRLWFAASRRADGTWDTRWGNSSPSFTPDEGATYIWDMGANTVIQEDNSFLPFPPIALALGGAIIVAYFLFLRD